MGEVIIPEGKIFLRAVNPGSAGEIYPYSVFILVCRQNFAYRDCDQFPGIVKKSESNGSDFPVCISAGDHLYGDINTKYTFHEEITSFLIKFA